MSHDPSEKALATLEHRVRCGGHLAKLNSARENILALAETGITQIKASSTLSKKGQEVGINFLRKIQHNYEAPIGLGSTEEMKEAFLQFRTYAGSTLAKNGILILGMDMRKAVVPPADHAELRKIIGEQTMAMYTTEEKPFEDDPALICRTPC
jgi:hypothetical protein